MQCSLQVQERELHDDASSVGWPGQAQAWVEKGPRGRESHGTARLSRDAMRHDEAS